MVGRAASLAADLTRAVDPVALAMRLGWAPDPWQAQVLRTSSGRVLLNCARQSGKSTTAALLAVHVAIYEPGALVLLLSPSQRQSAELFRTALGFYRALGRPVPAESENALSVTLESGSRIVSLPGSEPTVRGYSGVRLLVVDEAGRVPDDLMASVRPMLAVSGGSLVAMSTPAGRRGWWYEAWEEGGASWERVRITADQCPRISPDFLAAERAAMGDYWYAQEYLCQFVQVLESVFGADDVRAAFDPAVRPLFVGGGA